MQVRPFHTSSDLLGDLHTSSLGKMSRSNFFQPNPQLQIDAPDLPSQQTYRIGRRLARQVRCIKLKLWIWPKKIFIDSFCPQNIQATRPGFRDSLKFFWKALLYMIYFLRREIHINVLIFQLFVYILFTLLLFLLPFNPSRPIVVIPMNFLVWRNMDNK